MFNSVRFHREIFMMYSLTEKSVKEGADKILDQIGDIRTLPWSVLSINQQHIWLLLEDYNFTNCKLKFFINRGRMTQIIIKNYNYKMKKTG